MRLTLLTIENDATFHKNQDLGDVNNKLERVMQVVDDQIFIFNSELLHLTKVITIPMWHDIPRLNFTRIHHYH